MSLLTDPWLTTKEAAEYLGLKANTLDQMRVRGQGPKYEQKRFHTAVLYHVEELDIWSQEQDTWGVDD